MSNKSIAVGVILSGALLLLVLRRMLLAGLGLGLAVAGIVLIQRERRA